MHVYAFGSMCRGDINYNSDIDLLAIVTQFDKRFNPSIFSVYSYKRIKEIWAEGNPFAWHLHIESKLIFSSDSSDFIKSLGKPLAYHNTKEDCKKFFDLFHRSLKSINNGSPSLTFELSTMFLAIRNFATCYALGILKRYEFSRFSAIRLGEKSVPIENKTFSILECARMLSTRGRGNVISNNEIEIVVKNGLSVQRWMEKILKEMPYE